MGLGIATGDSPTVTMKVNEHYNTSIKCVKMHQWPCGHMHITHKQINALQRALSCMDNINIVMICYSSYKSISSDP